MYSSTRPPSTPRQSSGASAKLAVVSCGNARTVLVTGASIAGPALAYWLARYGFDVTLVERAPAIRTGGYAIDIRGTAIDVIDRMGILPAVRAEHVVTRQYAFLNGQGREVARVSPEDFAPSGGGRHVELARGALSSQLFELVRSQVKHRFGDAIAALSDGPNGVDVSFQSGARERFDLVVSGEGLHSTTRALVFGPEASFSRYLGYCFAICELPNKYGLRCEAAIYNTPGKAAVLRSTGDGPMVFALFAHRRPPPSPEEFADPQRQRDSMARAFAEDGWHVPEMIRAMQDAEDFYFDATTQIHMPAWSAGRAAVLGDAAFGPSFFSGQGTSMALVGAYMMAGALATHADPMAAFQSYEAATRPYVTANQRLVKNGSNVIAPGSALALWARNRMIRLAPLLSRLGILGMLDPTRGAFEALVLPSPTRSTPA
jgi:2-polyprenyl-6-methoxyphenol hydroxylase-like FAD-dependent oxidoreductase